MTPSVTVICCENRYVDKTAAWVSRANYIAWAAAWVVGTKAVKVETPREVVDRASYSRWLIENAPDLAAGTSHMLIVQSDGRVLNPHLWDDSWLDYDYVGAPWPLRLIRPEFQHRRVGNGGFSLRSTRLMHRVREIGGFEDKAEEDVWICQDLGDQLEEERFKFAPLHEAMRFAFEAELEDQPNHYPANCFGLHRPQLF